MMPTQTSRVRRLGQLLAGVVVLSLLCATAYWLIQSSQENARLANLATTNARLEQIGLALKNYHEEYHRFPPAVVLGPNGVPWHSWRVLLLPYLDQNELADKYRLDEPWDGPSNRLLIAACPEVFQLPTSELRTGCANACAVIGQKTAWPAQQPMRIRDFKRGMSNSILLVEAPPAREWTNPHDMGPREFLRAYTTSDAGFERALLFGDGSVRRIPQEKIDRKLLATLLAPHGRRSTFRGDDWPEMFKESRTVVQSEIVSSEVLESTTFHASWNEPIEYGKNNLWCAVFQMCWDNFAKITNGPVATSHPIAIANHLNKTPFDRTNLDSDSYTLEVVSGNSRSTEELLERIKENHPRAQPEFQTIDDGPSLRLYGCLEKSIQFPEELSSLKPLSFAAAAGDSRVETFGKESKGSEMGDAVFSETVYVGDYISDSNFIIVLRTDGVREDEIVLALVKPEATLIDSWQAVQKRLKKPHPNNALPQLHDGESLQIPIVDLFIDHSFSPLVGGIVTNIPGWPPSPIIKASEKIKFRMDQYGVDLMAEAEILVMFGSMGDDEPKFDPKKPRHFVFDRPFLLALREKSATEPYLLCWVANPEIMVPAAQQTAAGD